MADTKTIKVRALARVVWGEYLRAEGDVFEIDVPSDDADLPSFKAMVQRYIDHKTIEVVRGNAKNTPPRNVAPQGPTPTRDAAPASESPPKE